MELASIRTQLKMSEKATSDQRKTLVKELPALPLFKKITRRSNSQEEKYKEMQDDSFGFVLVASKPVRFS